MFKIIIMALALIAVIIVNGAANIVPLNGNTTVEIAHKLPILFMPANYVFFIWIVIYLLLAYWIFGFWKDRQSETNGLINRRMFLFILSSIFNIAWIVLWHYEYFNWTIVIMAILVATLVILYFTYPKYENRLQGRIPIALYLGWVMILFIINIIYVLTFHEWSGWGLSTPLWTVSYLTIATAIALHFMYHHRDIVLNIAFMWAFVGIAVKNGFEELFVSVAALFLAAALTVYLLFFNKDRK